MAEPASKEAPEKPLPRFSEQIRASAEYRRENGIEELTEEEAEEIAVAEVKKVREERRERLRRNS